MADPTGTDAPSTRPAPAVEARVGRSGYLTAIETRDGHRLAADHGATPAAPSPYDHLLSALGSCTAMTLRMYADRKGWPLEEAVVRLWHRRDHARDCERCETEEVGLHHVDEELLLVGPLSAEQRARLLVIAGRCPVRQTLAGCVRVHPAPPAAPG